VTSKINIPGTSWTLAVAPRNGWTNHRPNRWILLVLGFLVTVLCGVIAYWNSARRTDLKIAQQVATEQSALHQTTIGTMAQGVAVFDGDLKLVSFNEHYANLFDFPPDFLKIGQSWEEIARYRAEHGQYAEGGNIDQYIRERSDYGSAPDEVNRKNSLEGLYAAKERTAERTLPNGTVYVAHRKAMRGGGMVTTYTDITDRKTAEEAVRLAKEQAESANRTKSEFLANMSHELRTPLNSIIGFSEMMMNGSYGPLGNEKYLEFANDVNASAQHLLSLISDILDLSKAEAGKFELNEDAFDVAVLVRSCLRLMQQQAKSQGVALEMEIPNSLPRLYADQRMLKQITLNLLSNAIKFTPKGGRVILKVWSRPNAGLILQVIDTGVGVALNDIPNILKPFGQVQSTYSRKHRGTGLGLPLCKNFMELHGGCLDFQSEAGAGSIVTVRFPKERVVTMQPQAENIAAI